MGKSPFAFGKTVSLKAFTDRKVEAKRLYDNLTNGINTMLISPRRWGKSSLVEKVVRDIRRKEKATKVVVIDLFMVSSKEEFLQLFAKEVIRASSSRVNDMLNSAKLFFKNISPRMGFDVNSGELSLSFDKAELKKYGDEILDLPERIAEKKDIKIVVCIDEFQDLTSFGDYEELEKKMRAVWQRHKNVTYCLYGSKRHMMSDIFSNVSKPFYRFGDIMMLGKIPRSEWIKFLSKSFSSTSKSISVEHAGLIADLMQNHSWYVQQFASYVWYKTPDQVNMEIVRDAINELVASNIPFFIRELEVLSTTQLNFLKAIASGETALSGVEVMNKFLLGTSANVVKNKTILIQRDIIEFKEGEYEFLDPVFELWFKKRFFNIDFDVIPEM